MKIGMFTDSYLPTHDGVATSVAATSKELIKLGHQVTIIAPSHNHAKDSKNVYRLYSIRVLKSPEIYLGVEVTPKALLKIIDTDFDIIHGHSGGPVSLLGWQVARYHQVPFVETYHTMWRSYSHYFPFPQMLLPWFIKKISSFFGNDCEALIAPSEKIKKELLKYGVKKPVYLVPSGIDIELFTDIKPGYLHQRFSIPEDKKIILTVGRLEREKALDFLIRSFAETEALNCVLVIVGQGRDKQNLKSLAESLGIEKRVFFVGIIPLDDMSKVYADAKLFVFASQTEAQGMSLIEALASGLPVVAVKDEAYKGMVVDHFNGYLVEKDPKKFSQKIEHILKDQSIYKHFSQHAQRSAWKFSVFKTTKNLERVYLKIIKKKKSL
jgi:1,2-diacylglycerol 3-alpha-glucosyltransferase